jgi:hypothetical protein
MGRRLARLRAGDKCLRSALIREGNDLPTGDFMTEVTGSKEGGAR